MIDSWGRKGVNMTEATGQTELKVQVHRIFPLSKDEQFNIDLPLFLMSLAPGNKHQHLLLESVKCREKHSPLRYRCIGITKSLE